jgi:hypothetical protein
MLSNHFMTEIFMEVPFDGAQRSQWQVKDRAQFFCDLEPIFGRQLTTEDRYEIKLRLRANDPDYFEIPIYDRKSAEEPTAIVIFEDDKVFIDFIDPQKKQKYLEKIYSLVGTDIKVTNWRDLTQKDWLRRLDVLDIESFLGTL